MLGLGGVFARLAAPSHSVLRTRPFLELARMASNYKMKTKSAAKKRFNLNAGGVLRFRRTAKHHKMSKRTVANSLDGGLVRSFTGPVCTRLRKSYFPGW
ncbi:hypothetical protein T492DRAFT_994088 [Pavlovales sp. CCMP2436]|nr:hypothetical protein T492DRAFT_994088 [Pavlovales sp. CCMP2436]